MLSVRNWPHMVRQLLVDCTPEFVEPSAELSLLISEEPATSAAAYECIITIHNEDRVVVLQEIHNIDPDRNYRVRVRLAIDDRFPPGAYTVIADAEGEPFRTLRTFTVTESG